VVTQEGLEPSTSCSGGKREARRNAKLGARLRKLVKRHSSGCLLWIGYRDGCGYGRPRVNGRHVLANRLSWFLAVGPIPDGLHVLHKCDRPECVEPLHLYLGTHQHNMFDRDVKGRGVVPVRARGRWTGRFKRTGADWTGAA
jgi:hypothetical protein